jgi:hypothetical protein
MYDAGAKCAFVPGFDNELDGAVTDRDEIAGLQIGDERRIVDDELCRGARTVFPRQQSDLVTARDIDGCFER